MSSLTDRYVQATLRRLPARQRTDIERELRASIADAVDDRVDDGGDTAAAEVAALTHLGDPARLAAGYADRPLQLIGPAVFLDYTRLLTTLLVAVVPVVAAVVAFLRPRWTRRPGSRWSATAWVPRSRPRCTSRSGPPCSTRSSSAPRRCASLPTGRGPRTRCRSRRAAGPAGVSWSPRP
jgi:hypothetical protein